MKNSILKRVDGLLAYGNSVLRTDVAYLIKNGFWLSFESGLLVFAGFISALAFANLLDAKAYGMYKYVVVLVEICGLMSLSGLSTQVNRLVAAGDHESFPRAFVLLLLSNVVSIVIALAIAVYYWLAGDMLLASLVAIIGILLPVANAGQLYKPYLHGLKKFKLRSIVFGLQRLVIAAATIGVLFYFDNLIIIAVVIFGVSAITSTSLYFYFSSKIPLRTGNLFERDFFKPSLHFSIYNGIGQIVAKLESIIVFQFLGPTMLASYVFATEIPRQFMEINKSVKALALPNFVNRKMDELRRSLPHKSLILFLFMAVVVSAYWLLAPYIFQIFFPQYIGSVFYSQVFSLVLLFAPSSLYGQALISHYNAAALFHTNVFGGAVRLLLMLILVQFYGILGVVFAIIIGHAINFLIMVYYVSFKNT